MRLRVLDVGLRVEATFGTKMPARHQDTEIPKISSYKYHVLRVM